MRNFSASPREMMASLWRNRNLIRASVKREVLGSYRGSVMGIFRSFFNPLFMLAAYTVVFSVVFKVRWVAGSDSKSEFALVLFAGLMMFSLFAECANWAVMQSMEALIRERDVTIIAQLRLIEKRPTTMEAMRVLLFPQSKPRYSIVSDGP